MYLFIFSALAVGTIGFCCCNALRENRNHRRKVAEHKRKFREYLYRKSHSELMYDLGYFG